MQEESPDQKKDLQSELKEMEIEGARPEADNGDEQQEQSKENNPVQQPAQQKFSKQPEPQEQTHQPEPQ